MKTLCRIKLLAGRNLHSVYCYYLWRVVRRCEGAKLARGIASFSKIYYMLSIKGYFYFVCCHTDRRAYRQPVGGALWNRNKMNRDIWEFFWYCNGKRIAFDFLSLSLGWPDIISSLYEVCVCRCAQETLLPSLHAPLSQRREEKKAEHQRLSRTFFAIPCHWSWYSFIAFRNRLLEISCFHGDVSCF